MRTMLMSLLSLCCLYGTAAAESGYFDTLEPIYKIAPGPLPPAYALEQMRLGCTAAKDESEHAECLKLVEALDARTTEMMGKVIALGLMRERLSIKERRGRFAEIEKDFAKVKRASAKLGKRCPFVEHFLRFAPQTDI